MLRSRFGAPSRNCSVSKVWELKRAGAPLSDFIYAHRCRRRDLEKGTEASVQGEERWSLHCPYTFAPCKGVGT